MQKIFKSEIGLQTFNRHMSSLIAHLALNAAITLYNFLPLCRDIRDVETDLHLEYTFISINYFYACTLTFTYQMFQNSIKSIDFDSTNQNTWEENSQKNKVIKSFYDFSISAVVFQTQRFESVITVTYL
jgi:hypothetical protein